MLKNNRFNNN